jgi:REP element-mobilizing transposase RayT
VEKPGVFRLTDMERLVSALLRMTENPLVLDHKQRSIVEATIRKHCQIRKWELHAVSCRTNHVHVVVSANRNPGTVMDQFKAWCTRHLKEDFVNRLQAANEKMRENWWTQRGSKRVINNQDSLESAIRYVLEGQ